MEISRRSLMMGAAQKFTGADVRQAALVTDVFFSHLDEIGGLADIHARARSERQFYAYATEQQIRDIAVKGHDLGIPFSEDEFVAAMLTKQGNARIRAYVRAVSNCEGPAGHARRIVALLHALANRLDSRSMQPASMRLASMRLAAMKACAVLPAPQEEEESCEDTPPPPSTEMSDEEKERWCMVLDVGGDYTGLLAIFCPPLAVQFSVITLILWLWEKLAC